MVASRPGYGINMKIIIAGIIFAAIMLQSAYGGDQLGDYLNDQVPIDYEYPLWMKIFGEYFLRIIMGGMIFFSVSGIPEKRLLSARGLIGVFAATAFFAITILYHNLYTQVLEIGFKSFALLIGGLLLLGIFLQALRSGLQKLLNK